ncbi:MAG: hypothetical protein U0794_07680 [Isosphaeraceae bacterium]
MRFAIGLLALALVGADAPAQPPSTQIVYDLRFVELSSVAWRGELHAKLQPVTRQGGVSVWTAPKEVAAQVAKAATSSSKGSIISAPRVTAYSGSTAHIFHKSPRNIVADVERGADGPVNHATRVAYVPKLEKIREGMATTVNGRKLDQGILAQIVLEDTHVAAIHRVALSEVLEPSSVKPGDASKATVHIQVPEVEHREVAGEWLIPHDHVLIVSFGVATVAESNGRAGVRERLALVEARAIEAPAQTAPASPAAASASAQPVNQAAYARTISPAPVVQFTPVLPLPPGAAGIPMPAPRAPSRSLPYAVNLDGVHTPLPPLPEDHAPPTSLPHSSEPCATPQTRGHRGVIAEPVPEGPSSSLSGDEDVTKASVEFPACCANQEFAIPEIGDVLEQVVPFPNHSAEGHGAGAKSDHHPAPAPPLAPETRVRASGLLLRLLGGSITLEFDGHSDAGSKPSIGETTPADAAPVHPY